jgi:hypothetical protein
MRHRVRDITRAAGLRDELTFTSFRQGGFTEAADSDLADAEMRAQGRHESFACRGPAAMSLLSRILRQLSATTTRFTDCNRVGLPMAKCLIQMLPRWLPPMFVPLQQKFLLTLSIPWAIPLAAVLCSR